MGNELTICQAVIDEIREIIRQGRTSAYQAVNTAQVMTYWEYRSADRGRRAAW